MGGKAAVMRDRSRALVTGAGVRIGRAIAVCLARRGYDLVLHHHSSQEAVQETARLCSEQGASTRLVRADLGNAEALERACGELSEHWSKLELLVNNAALFYPTPDLDSAEREWDHFADVNLKAPFRMVRHLYPLLASACGCVVNIVDIWGVRPLRGYLPYCVAKAGLAALTRGLALELAPRVRVNGVAPGAAMLAAGATPDTERRLVARIPLGRLGSPEDVAEAVAYLAEAPYVTGQILTVDGGRSVAP